MNNILPASISVVIPTYGRERVLIRTVDAILQLSVPPKEIIVVDQSVAHCQKTNWQLGQWLCNDQIKWIRLLEPSIPHAMNRGLLVANAELVLFLDDDIIPSASLIAAHLEAHSKDTASLIAGRVVQPWHKEQSRTPPQNIFDFNSPVPCEAKEFMGGNFSINRKRALEVGGFDENFVKVAYRFEAEFAHRWLNAGEQIYYESEAWIEHLKAAHGGTRSYGEHFATITPAHSVGAHYFLMKTKGVNSIPSIVTRILNSVKTKHHFKKPWWIPITLISEVGGVLWAVVLTIRGPRYLSFQ